ncbi:MAG: globin family protein [Gammaproteobacteria bacterium]
MTPEQQHLIQTSWAQLTPIADQAAALFYARLFELDPALKPLFTGDMKAQGAKLMQAINLVVRSLDKLDSLLPALQTLGQRHVGYGVQAAHYDTVGTALLWTLEQGLGDTFTASTRTAWGEAYSRLATVMQSAGKAAVPA